MYSKYDVCDAYMFLIMVVFIYLYNGVPFSICIARNPGILVEILVLGLCSERSLDQLTSNVLV